MASPAALKTWKLKGDLDKSLDNSTEDSGDSSTSPSSSRSVDGGVGFDSSTALPLSPKEAMSVYRIRSSSVESMSICGWDFLMGRRRTRWGCQTPPVAYHRPIPEVYVDEVSRLDLVWDMSKLKRGDHCVIVLNVFRTLNPWIDYLHSLLSGYGYFRMYHHFLVLDDVVKIDSNGVPRNEDGIAVEIMEYSNTASQFLADAKQRGFVKNLLDKAKCRRVALIDYGDNAYFYRFRNEHCDDSQRDVIVQRAIDFMTCQPRYHIIYQNCEHTTNFITMKDDDLTNSKSALVDYVYRNLCRYILHCFLTMSGICFDALLCSNTGCSARANSVVTLLNVLLVCVDIVKHVSYPCDFKYEKNRHTLSRSSLYAYELTRFCIVITLSFGIVDYVLARQEYSVLVRSLCVCHAYWVSDTLIFNTLVNIYAAVAKTKRGAASWYCK